MATAGINPMAIPGLHIPPTLDDLEASRLAYNELPDVEDQAQVGEVALADLKAILEAFEVQKKFGYHLAHGHLRAGPGRVMLGRPMTKLDACWTRPTKVSEVDRENIHGHIFMLVPNRGFTAYEYRQGPLPQMTKNDTAFFYAVEKYLGENGLGNLVGIEVLPEEGPANEMREFVLSDSYGTIMMDTEKTKSSRPTRVTGWSIVQKGEGITELKGKESHAETMPGPHKVFIDGKLHREGGGGADDEAGINEMVVLDALRRDDVIG